MQLFFLTLHDSYFCKRECSFLNFTKTSNTDVEEMVGKIGQTDTAQSIFKFSGENEMANDKR